MKLVYRLLMSILGGYSPAALFPITTLSPDQSIMDYLDQEVIATGFDRSWLLALKDDPIIKKTEAKAAIATPEEGSSLWLEAANRQAQRGKANEVIYCLYKRNFFIKQWSATPFRWTLFIDLGATLSAQKNNKLSRNPLSIAIKNNDLSLIETVLPKDPGPLQESSGPIQTYICQTLTALLQDAIERNNIPIASTLIGRLKLYHVWDHESVKKFKAQIATHTIANKTMVEMLKNEGIAFPNQST